MRGRLQKLLPRRTPHAHGCREIDGIPRKAEARGAEQALPQRRSRCRKRPAGVTVGGIVSFSPPALTAKRPQLNRTGNRHDTGHGHGSVKMQREQAVGSARKRRQPPPGTTQPIAAWRRIRACWSERIRTPAPHRHSRTAQRPAEERAAHEQAAEQGRGTAPRNQRRTEPAQSDRPHAQPQRRK